MNSNTGTRRSRDAKASLWSAPVLLVAALIIALALAACGGGDAADSDGEGAGSTSRAEATESQASAEPQATEQNTPESTRRGILGSGGGQASAEPESTEEAEATPETDREALIALYNATDGENWYQNDNWLTGEPLDQWERVNTDDNGRVIELIRGANQLSGEIPPELGNLANLKWMDLSDSQLSGEIPPELGKLANLELLRLHANRLTREIPPELGNLANVESLDLSYNQLSGEMPTQLGNLANLEWLRLVGNQLSGCVLRSL